MNMHSLFTDIYTGKSLFKKVGINGYTLCPLCDETNETTGYVYTAHKKVRVFPFHYIKFHQSMAA